MKPSVFESGDDTGAPFMEHRWGRRVPCRICVRIAAASGVSSAGRLRDVSMSGAFIETALELPPFAQLQIAVLRDDPLGEISIPASVVRVERDGIGVEWCEPSTGPICTVLGCTTRCTAATTPPCEMIN